MTERLTVMVSSTANDLPEYRKQVLDACQRVEMHATMMEYLSAKNAGAVDVSLAMVDEADVYVGVFAHRYGYVPEGYDRSITEMEYRRAIEKGIPVLIFLIGDNVPVLPKDFDTGKGAEKLHALKEEIKTTWVVDFFESPKDLRGLVIQSLIGVKEQFDTADSDEEGKAKRSALVETLHYVSAIPQPPEEYVAHPYTLLQVRGLVGRQAELELLTDWVTGKRYGDVRVFNVVAIGGMGKSALTWTWFNDVAPQEITPLAGRLWWSFYESDATYENFVTRALAYVGRRPLDEVAEMKFPEQEDLLLRILDREPFLLVLDGLERILTAYTRQDAAFLSNDELDEETANRVAGALGLPESAGQSYVGKHKLRLAADPRAGRFLRRLARVKASRTLVSTRLYPTDIQARSGQPLPGCFALFIPGLNDQDALALWREHGARGSRGTMLPVFETFDKHPLLIQLLAAEVAEDREAVGDFDKWRELHPGFDPFGLPLVQVQSHVLLHAMQGLSPAELKTLRTIAGFRMPASLDTLTALLVRTEDDADPVSTPFAALADLDAVLTTLEDRGLLGWDRRANRYDLHPIVRGVVWSGLDDSARTGLLESLHNHFAGIPMVEDWQQVESLEDLTPAIELYDKLIRLERYGDAFEVFHDRLEEATLYRLSTNRLRVELLQRLLPNNVDAEIRLKSPNTRGVFFNSLGMSSQLVGQPGVAASHYQRAKIAFESDSRHISQATTLEHLSIVFRFGGRLRAAESSARLALSIAREQGERFGEASSLQWFGLVLAARGRAREAETALERSLRIWRSQEQSQSEGVSIAFQAVIALRYGDLVGARELADHAWSIAHVLRSEVDFVRASRLQGIAAFQLGNNSNAQERLQHTLTRARSSSLVGHELPTLIALAELHRQQAEPEKARELLDDVWDPAEVGPYPLFHADALNVLAQIERDAGHTDAAVEAATRAYKLAWCDGPPYAYHWGLEKAKAHLAALGVPEPTLPPFDEAQHEPMPEVELNPEDEFHVPPPA